MKVSQKLKQKILKQLRIFFGIKLKYRFRDRIFQL